MYDLQDAGYDADIIREFSIKHNHRPIIDINPKNSKEIKAKIELRKHEEIIFNFEITAILLFILLFFAIGGLNLSEESRFFTLHPVNNIPKLNTSIYIFNLMK